MNDVVSHLVRFEPVGIEMDVHEGETVLDAAFRQGISVMHGCKEGQCASCKSKLIEGDIELLKYCRNRSATPTISCSAARSPSATSRSSC
jgi:propane monooxygenase reductase subunit